MVNPDQLDECYAPSMSCVCAGRRSRQLTERSQMSSVALAACLRGHARRKSRPYALPSRSSVGMCTWTASVSHVRAAHGLTSVTWSPAGRNGTSAGRARTALHDRYSIRTPKTHQNHLHPECPCRLAADFGTSVSSSVLDHPFMATTCCLTEMCFDSAHIFHAERL